MHRRDFHCGAGSFTASLPLRAARLRERIAPHSWSPGKARFFSTADCRRCLSFDATVRSYRAVCRPGMAVNTFGLSGRVCNVRRSNARAAMKSPTAPDHRRFYYALIRDRRTGKAIVLPSRFRRKVSAIFPWNTRDASKCYRGHPSRNAKCRKQRKIWRGDGGSKPEPGYRQRAANSGIVFDYYVPAILRSGKQGNAGPGMLAQC